MRAPPMAQLCTALFMGTTCGRAARISAVGASNSGVTKANHRGWSAGMLIFCRSRGLVLLHCTAVAGDCPARVCLFCRDAEPAGVTGEHCTYKGSVCLSLRGCPGC